jgi:signal transduction histidine kinase
MLTAFKRLIHAGSEAEILGALADAAVTELGAEAAACVQLQPTGEARVVTARGLPAGASLGSEEVDVIDEHLGERLRASCIAAAEHEVGRLAHMRVFAMMSGGDIFGALVVFYARGAAPSEKALGATETLADLAAIALGRARQHEELRRSYVELRSSREILERTQKLRALGEMAAGISHDLKNILNPISLHLQLLKRVLRRANDPPPAALDAIAEMEGVILRGVETVERLRDFSRQAPERRMETVDPDLLAHEALELARPRLAASVRSRGVRLVEQLGRPPPILAHAAELLTALLNLMVNAIDAMPDGGTVTIATGARDGASWVRVEDDGPGMPEDVRARAFEPFFTTKGREGTGLGLAMVYAIVQRHGGTVTLDTTPGVGTTFMLSFPVADRAHGAADHR